MAEMVVSASALRVFFKDLANSTAEEQHRVVITRHGHKLVALVSQEDLEFLRKHKPQPTERPVPDPVPSQEAPYDPFIGAEHPGEVPTSEIERVYRETEGTDDEYLRGWRSVAAQVLKERTGRVPG